MSAMSQHVSAMKPLLSRKSKGLAGRIAVPGDKSMSHRSLMLGAVAHGETVIDGLLDAEDVIHTARAMNALGARVEKDGQSRWHVTGLGVGGLLTPAAPLDFGNSGTGVRLALGLMATTGLTARCVGDASLSKRPMGRATKPLSLFGARFETSEGDRLPLTLHGAADANGITYELPVASAQVKSAVLLAGLNASGVTTVIEKVPTRNHTELMLKAFGARISTKAVDGATHICVEGRQPLRGLSIAIPGDPSSAAFPMVGALITEGSDLVIPGIMLNPTRTGLITTLVEMGADITVENRRLAGGEEVGDLRVKSSRLHGVRVPPERAPSMIDEYPIRMEGLGELRVKESDRLAAVEAGLQANGVATQSGPDWLEVHGGGAPGGGKVKTHMDHRIAMSFIVMGLASRIHTTVDDASFIATSFPGFSELMNGVGARIEVA
jgi:3-phosphoshikimate 1-carboxyvinyltransferase